MVVYFFPFCFWFFEVVDNFSCLLLHLFSLSGSVLFQIIFLFRFYLHLPPEFYYEKNLSIQQNLEGGSDIDLSVIQMLF